jgi:hypothetical protein
MPTWKAKKGNQVEGAEKRPIFLKKKESNKLISARVEEQKKKDHISMIKKYFIKNVKRKFCQNLNILIGKKVIAINPF